MIARDDKRRQFAAHFGRGHFDTPVHTPNLAAGLGIALVVILGLSAAVFLPDLFAGAGAVLAVPPLVGSFSRSGKDGEALVAAREKFEEKKAALAKVFEEAKTADGAIDFRNVKCLGKEFEGQSVRVRDHVIAAEKELGDLWDDVLTKVAEQEGQATVDRIEAGMKGGMVHAPESDPSNPTGQVKSAGARIIESDAYKNRKTGEGISFDFKEAYPSEFLAVSRKAIKTLMTTSAGFAPESIRLPGWVDKESRPVQLLDIIPSAQTTQAAIAYMLETTRTHSAAEKAEGAAFAESAFAFTAQSVTVVKVTDSLPVTDEQIDDAPMIEGYINNRLMFGLRQRLDLQVLNGNGTPPNMEGILNVTGIQTQAKGGDTIPDAFYKAMTLVRVTGRAIPTHNVIHSTDWQTVRLLKTADGIYIWGSPAEAGPERMWGLPVVQQDAISAGTGVVGSFDPQWITLFERQGVDIQVGYSGTQFVEGEKTVRGTLRAALVVFRPGAFCSVTGL